MAAASAAAAIVINAIKASGAIVSVEPQAFAVLLGRSRQPLVICAEGGLFKKNYQYLMSYKGLAFFTKSPAPLVLPADAELVTAKKIWTPQ